MDSRSYCTSVQQHQHLRIAGALYQPGWVLQY